MTTQNHKKHKFIPVFEEKYLVIITIILIIIGGYIIIQGNINNFKENNIWCKNNGFNGAEMSDMNKFGTITRCYRDNSTEYFKIGK